MAKNIKIEIVHGQDLHCCEVSAGSTIQDVLGDMHQVVGVFGQLKSAEYVLCDGDRIEFYQPLLIDPKTARRIKARNNAKKRSKKA